MCSSSGYHGLNSTARISEIDAFPLVGVPSAFVAPNGGGRVQDLIS
jgi:hypothetical protein